MSLNRLRFLTTSMLLTLVLAGCAGAATPVADQAAPVQPTAAPAIAATDTPLPAPTATAEPEPTEEPSPTAEPTATETPVQVDPTAEPTAELSTAEIVAAAFSAAPTAAGEVILVTGRVLDLSGNPLPGAAVEFWHTDANGVYDHPGDPDHQQPRPRLSVLRHFESRTPTVAMPSAPCGRVTTSHGPSTSTSRSSSTAASC